MNELKQEILEKINHPSLHMGIYIENLKTKEQLCYQEDDVFETASTIKVFILAYLYHEFSCNHLKREDTVKYELEHVTTGTSILSLLEPGFSISLKNCAILMITYSDNIATNLLIDALGGVDKINQFIRELGFSKTKLLNKICVEKGLPVGVTTAQE
ncbi:MAG: serine hydrolase [Firmicutes bacterium]|nr:serine hydrolase [Bacillota bacterium]